jgi:hypothetical protein
LWIANGGNKAAAPIAAAIAMAESAGDSTASNLNTNGSIDRGLWQINSVHGAQSTFDVTGNVKAAIAISSNGTNWTPWVTFNTGAYKKFLQGNISPTTPPGQQPTSPAQTTGLISWPGDITDFFNNAKTFIDALLWIVNPASWLRIGSFAMGILLILAAIWLFIKVGSDEPIIGKGPTIPLPVPV